MNVRAFGRQYIIISESASGRVTPEKPSSVIDSFLHREISTTPHIVIIDYLKVNMLLASHAAYKKYKHHKEKREAAQMAQMASGDQRLGVPNELPPRYSSEAEYTPTPTSSVSARTHAPSSSSSQSPPRRSHSPATPAAGATEEAKGRWVWVPDEEGSSLSTRVSAQHHLGGDLVNRTSGTGDRGNSNPFLGQTHSDFTPADGQR